MDVVIFEGLLFVASLVIGVVAAMAGVGGGVVFTPLMLAFTQMDTTVIRAAGLALAMTTSAFGGRKYFLAGAARLNLVLFTSLFMSLGVVTGALVGIHVVKSLGKAGEAIIRLTLGVLLFFIVLIMLTVKPREVKSEASGWSRRLGLYGAFKDPATGEEVSYTAQRLLPTAFALFGVGLISGAFGLGAGWALVPVLNLITGLPIKIAVATSTSTFIVADAPGLWAYVHEGVATPLVLAPALVGVAIGSNIGARLALKAKARVIRLVVISVMLIAAAQLVIRGLMGLGLI